MKNLSKCNDVKKSMNSSDVFTNFSQYEQLQKKTNFLLVKTGLFSQFAS